jgi:hypothetical protein
MARIFNIYFTYSGIMHNAIVTVRTTPFITEYTLNIFNDDLLNLLPGNKILSQRPGHFIFKDASPEHSADLMNSIIKAVNEHLEFKV